ncbi:MAG TPA: CheR family methyltransferase [Verrucomicrobiae bacterium]|jgi:two-component system CheB/CheR fusion protein|nr:CheR family methyltransferase [Verrucomicrobiae bacterium]
MSDPVTDKEELRKPVEGLPLLNPDEAEEELGEEIDNIVPTRGYQTLPMVGLGGSAGSIGPLQQFFKAMAPDSGMVFVVILHLAPEHQSTLPELLQRCTPMRVFSAEDGQKVEANTVYVIPPGKFLSSVDGRLQLTNLVPERGRRVTIDLFFRTMADTHGSHSAAIIFSGSDGDGSIGIKRIKERGGLTIAQDPEEAEHGDMPRAAIATGMVDWVLRVEEMPARLLEYNRREQSLKLPPEEGPQPAQAARESSEEREVALRDVLAYLQTRTARDFSYYKRATILRRIGRRMQVNGIEDLPGYLTYLRTHPGESGALLQDLLIPVTNFFRDRESFQKLEKHIPELFQGKGTGDMVRVWVAACATGEEAYSIAMLLTEYASKLEAPPSIQIFASDLGEEAIQAAREGIYPEAIAADVSEERLRRFFAKEHGCYRVRRELRETVLFALHDLLKDSPFSRIDLISCRNLLIYLNRGAQRRIFEIFHFSLRPDGLLFLGASETMEGSELFDVLDKKARLYAPRNLPRKVGNGAPSFLIAPLKRSRERPVVPQIVTGGAMAEKPASESEGPAGEKRTHSWSELHYKLLENLAPPSLIVNQEYEIRHLSEHANRFLQFTGGEPSRNLLQVIHPMLRIELRAALYRAMQSKDTAEALDVPLEVGGHSWLVTIRVSMAQHIAPEFLLVVFESREPAQPQTRKEASGYPGDSIASALERELEEMKTHLRDTVEQYEASTEELKASNEELQAMNEELHSATEELETSREELESVNEELITVNQEMKSSVEDLAHANSDLNNLMASTAIATIFLDRDLHITRFTPAAVDIFKLIPTDAGRPLTDLTHRLDYPALSEDAKQVLARLVPIEREVKEQGGNWFLARLLPYRTAEDRIGGIVLTFVNITERKANEKTLLETKDKLELANRTLEEKISERTVELTDSVEELEAFSYTVAHDMRAPLRAMQGFAALILEEHAAQLDEDARKYLGRIQTSSDRLDRLIREVLNYNRMARQELLLEPVDLAALVPEILNSYPNLQKPDVEVQVEQPLPVVIGNDVALTQIFANLLGNAVKFVRTGVKAKIRIYAEAVKIGDSVRFWIEDNGIGIEPANYEKIFRMFQYLNRPGLYEGSGIGLAIVRKAAEKMGGQVGLESVPGQGSRFWIQLKAAKKPGDKPV